MVRDGEARREFCGFVMLFNLGKVSMFLCAQYSIKVNFFFNFTSPIFFQLHVNKNTRGNLYFWFFGYPILFGSNMSFEKYIFVSSEKPANENLFRSFF